MTEIEIKIRLAQHLLRKVEIEAIGAETPFLDASKRADMISIENRVVTSYEIKSATDKVSRLEGQLEDYQSIFDYCYVVCEKSNLKSVRDKIKKKFGIILVTNTSVKTLRKSNQFKRHDKESLASTIKTSHLRALVKARKLASRHELCSYAARVSTEKELYHLSRKCLEERYLIPTKILRSEIKSAIHPDDIQTITKPAPTELVIQS